MAWKKGSSFGRTFHFWRSPQARMWLYANWLIAALALVFLWFVIDGRSSNGVMLSDTTSARLARSLAIVRESTAARPQVLRVLFYGQSTTSPHWTNLAHEHLS